MRSRWRFPGTQYLGHRLGVLVRVLFFVFFLKTPGIFSPVSDPAAMTAGRRGWVDGNVFGHGRQFAMLDA